MNKARDDIICAKMDREEKICIVCKHFVENRTPESIIKYGDDTGICIVEDAEIIEDENFTLIVNPDSSCNLYESLFD